MRTDLAALTPFELAEWATELIATLTAEASKPDGSTVRVNLLIDRLAVVHEALRQRLT